MITDFSDCSDMVPLNQEKSTQCVVHDLTPGSEQKKINIVVRSQYTIEKVFRNISTQYPYEAYDLILQPNETENSLVRRKFQYYDLKVSMLRISKIKFYSQLQIHLNARRSELLFGTPGFAAQEKNVLVLLPSGIWDGDVQKRFDFTKPLSKKKCISKSNTSIGATTPKKSTTKAAKAVKASNTIKASSATKASSTVKASDVDALSIGVSTPPTAINGVDATSSTVGNNTTKGTMNGHSEVVVDEHGTNNNEYVDIMADESNKYNENILTSNMMSDLGGSDDASSTIAEESLPLYTATAIANTRTTNTASMTHSLKLSPLSDPELLSDDDLALGASASPTETEPFGGDGMLKLRNTSPHSSKYGPLTEGEMYQQMDRDFTRLGKKLQPISASAVTNTTAATGGSTMSTISSSGANGYVGLVNQAMTCYLNSLLQALFMTPEFRNALYRWEFDNDNEAKNIPYQLQKLFLNLQTSKKSAVETTDLTRSFGWDSTEAWQQHDIQELCRVMFDALEHKFKNTKQMNLIASLYEGKMIDYVKCLECNTEKTRADTFLDIPLPVRPFGSTVAYGSIEEALRAFVQPETLDGNNQYFCEKCNKKCDAHKGLKFKNFPYILTLHLKRFDFDYQTMHRIKLNDK